MEWNGSIKSKGQDGWPNRPNGLVCSFMVTEERAMPSYHAAAMPSPGWDSTIEPVGRDFLHFSFF